MFSYIKFDVFFRQNLLETAAASREEGIPPTQETSVDLSHLSPEDKTRVEILRKEFETIKLSQQFVGGVEGSLRTALLRDGDPKDKEYAEIVAKIQRYQQELKQYGEQESQIQMELGRLLGEVKTEIRKFSSHEVGALKNIDNKEFLSIPSEKRLQYITKNHIDSSEVASGEVNQLDFTFTFEGQFNRDLYLKTTTGQVLPKEVGEVKVGGELYTRNNIGGEFFTPENKRLTIHEGTKIEVFSLRTPQELEQIGTQNNQKITEYLQENPEANVQIISQAINRGIDPKFANIAFEDLVKRLPDEQVKVVLEDAFTEFDRMRAKVEASITDLQDGKYDENLAIGVIQKFSPDNWKNKAIIYGFSQEKIENFVNISNTKIDFSSIENGDMKAMIEKTAENLGITPKIIRSILIQESNGNMSATRFEKHVYDRELRKGNNPDDAKLLATSFGGFQIMGFNHKVCGYNSVVEFVEAMKNPENQFNAFASFIRFNPSLHNAMKGNTPDFSKIAYYYNGPLYAQNNYDNKIRQHFYA